MAVTKKKITKTAEKADKTSKALKLAGQLHWAEPAIGHEIATELLKNAAKSIADLIPRLSESNDEQATQAFFALEAIVMTALDPEVENETCKAVVVALADNLPLAKDCYSRSQVIRYLGLLGYDVTEALRSWLDQPEYFEVTLLALRHIGSLSAFELITEKLATASGNAYTAFALAAADWEEEDAIEPEKMRKALAKAPAAELPALWNACACCGLAFVAEDLLKACQGKTKVLAAAARASLALLVDSIRNWEKAVALGQQFYQTTPCAISLRTWFDACGQDITADCYEALTDAVQEENQVLRETALELLGKASDSGVETEMLVEFAGSLTAPTAKAALLRMLGRHGKMIARPLIMASLWDKDLLVRQAAIEAAESLQGKLDARSLQAVVAHRN